MALMITSPLPVDICCLAAWLAWSTFFFSLHVIPGHHSPASFGVFLSIGWEGPFGNTQPCWFTITN